MLQVTVSRWELARCLSGAGRVQHRFKYISVFYTAATTEKFKHSNYQSDRVEVDFCSWGIKINGKDTSLNLTLQLLDGAGMVVAHNVEHKT